MILTLLKEKTSALAFIIAAGIAPIAFFLPLSCGAACAGCPAGGGCLLIPAVAAGIGAAGLRSRIRAGLSRIVARA